MSNKLYFFTAALVGVVCGFFTIHSFFAHSWASIILWIIVGLIVLYFSSSRKSALFAGGAFGFFTIITWLASGFAGAPDQMKGFAILAIGLGILGALSG